MSGQVKIRDHIKVEPAENLIIWMIYFAAIPLARVALYFKMSPNFLTTLSSGFALSSGTTLLIEGLHDAFIPLFTISLLLDFADGLVARTTGKIGRTAFRYDHISDLFKIPFVALCIVIFCDSTLVWILGMCSTMLFLISTVLSHDLNFAIKKEAMRSKLDSHKKIEESKNAIITNIFTIFFTFNSHALLTYVLIAAKPQFAPHIFTYLIMISTYACARYIKALTKLEP